jgi:hypothetical protein
VTPVPPPTQPSRSGNPLALILLGLVAIAGIAVGALAAGGAFSHATSTQTITPAGTVTPAPGLTGTATSSPSTTAPPPSTATNAGGATGTTSCGGDVSIGPNTSCGFAVNVEKAYDVTSGGDQTVTAFSPATGQTYTINCTGGSPHFCTGGTTRNAAVYFTSGPSGSSGSSSSAGLRACDQNISANQYASCPFAENVFKAYASDYQANGQQSNVNVTAYSPVTNQSYAIDCTTDGVTVNCTGASSQVITFSLHAVQVY